MAAETGAARLIEAAPAKVNLSLRVLGRRADGYHEIESLVAFAGIGDRLELVADAPLSLQIAAPAALGAGDDNLVLRAARAFLREWPGARAGAFTLEKHIPVAAGLGGGSADAAAALRLLARLNGLQPAERRLFEIAAGIGADVPVCLEGRARVMRGIGERLDRRLSLPRLPCVLVNPNVPVSTVNVFAALGLAPGDVVPGPGDASLAALDGRWRRDLLLQLRNYLEPPALRIAPVIGEVLAALRDTAGCWLARMSGSGATCFGLYEDAAAAANAAGALRRRRPDWWVAATVLG